MRITGLCKHLMDTGCDSYCLCDGTGRIQGANLCLCALVGKRHEELVHYRLHELFAGSTEGAISEQLAAARKQHFARFRMPVLVGRSDRAQMEVTIHSPVAETCGRYLIELREIADN